MYKQYKLFIPGPVNVDASARCEMQRDMISHRGEDFKRLHHSIVHQMKHLLNTGNDVFLLTCSASGALEAAVRNTVDRYVLCLANGDFGRRFHEIAVTNGKDATLLDFGDGIPIDLNAVGSELKKGPYEARSYDAVTVVLNDTATGIKNDVEDLKGILKDYPQTLLLVDSVTAAFGTEIDLQGIDVLVFGTQKALALPPGMSVAIVSEKALDRAKTTKSKGYYFDFIQTKKKADEDFVLTTPNIPLMYGLDYRLREIGAIGVEAYIGMHKDRARLTENFFLSKGLGLLIDEGHRSDTVTVVKIGESLDVKAMINHLKGKGYLIANGYGRLKDKTFRIGHMGVTIEDTQKLLDDIGAYISR